MEEISEKAEAPAEATEAPAESDDDSKTKKKRGKRSKGLDRLIEIAAVVVLFYFVFSGLSGKFVLGKFAPFKIEATGIVESIDEVTFVGDAEARLKLGNLADSKYCTRLAYEINGRYYHSNFYSVSAPIFSVGDSVKVKVDATDYSNVIEVK